MFYLVLSSIFFILGVLRERGVFPFLLLISCLPLSNAFSDYFYRFGIYAYDFFFFGIITTTAAKAVTTKIKTAKIPKWASASFILIITYSLVALASNVLLDTYFLRDYRPAIFSLEIIAATVLLSSGKSIISSQQAYLIPVLAGSTNLLWLALSIAGVISSDDEYFNTNSYKYMDASTYISAIFIILYFSKRKSSAAKERLSSNPLKLLAITMSLLSVIFSGYRALLLATAIAAAASSIKSPKKLLPIIIIAAISIPAFLYISEHFGASRVSEGLTTEGLKLQLLTRYGPAISVIDSFNFMEFLTGKGFGTAFEIAWFEYRSLDTKNNFVDSAYVTFFAKYGILGLCYLALISVALSKTAPSEIKKPIIIYVAMLFTVYAISYQPASAGLIAGCILAKLFNRTHAPLKYEPRTVQIN